MVYRTAQFSMTLTPNPRVRVWVRVGKVKKPYPNFQMVPLSITLSDLWPTFQGHDNIQRPIIRLTVSRVWSVQWFRFQWPWVTLNVDFNCHGDVLDELCAQLTRDLFAIAKFLFTEIWRYNNFQNGGRPPSWNCFTTMREKPPTKSLLLAAAACQISCQSDAQIWRYSYLNFSHIWLEMPIHAPKMGVLGDFEPINMIIHHRDSKRHSLT